MSFLLGCPNCGKRNVGEFSFRGEYHKRPAPSENFETWVDYVYFKENVMGPQLEWWFHRAGCRRWFLVERDTTDNTKHTSFWFEDLKKRKEPESKSPRKKAPPRVRGDL